jgi:2-iminobutanoate/2-iminopropanoate deaminase
LPIMESISRAAVSASGDGLADASRWGDLLFLSGRASVDANSFRLRTGGFEEQARFVLDEVADVLACCGSSMAHVLRVEAYLVDAGDFPAWNRVFGERFPSSPPARTTLVTGFALDGMLIEVQVTAGLPE